MKALALVGTKAGLSLAALLRYLRTGEKTSVLGLTVALMKHMSRRGWDGRPSPRLL
jgi:hypothetical protein